MKEFYAIDLFSGAGGFSEGILQAGFHIVFSNDINKMAAETYMNRHHQLGYIDGVNTKYVISDIKNITSNIIFESISSLKDTKISQLKEIDVIFGGPPCQGFSRAGRRDPNDPRNYLFLEYIRVVSEVLPKYVVIENVEGFLDTKLQDFKGLTKSYSGENLLPYLLENELNIIGYNVLKPQLLNASDFGVPQNRKRAIFIAYRNDCIAPRYPKKIEGIPVTFKEAVYDLYNSSYSSEYSKKLKNGITPSINGNPISSSEIKNQENSKHQENILDRFRLFKEGESASNLRSRISREGISLKNTYYESLFSQELLNRFKLGNVTEDEINLLLTKKNNRIKLSSKLPSRTIVTIADDYICPYSNMALTVREMARLQSFDDSFIFYGKRTTGGKNRAVETPQQTQVGNAVPPMLARVIANVIMIALKSNAETKIT